MIRAEATQPPAIVIATVPEIPFMLGVLGSANAPSSTFTIQAVEDLSINSCQFVDNFTREPLDPNSMSSISVTGSTLGSSMVAGETADITFGCSTNRATSEWLRYSCDTPQGNFSMETQCTITSSQVDSWFNTMNAIVGDTPPTVDVQFTALNTELNNLACGFEGSPSKISLINGSLSGTLLQGQSEKLTFSCDTSTIGNEQFVSYACDSDQGRTNVFLNCNVEDPAGSLSVTPELLQLETTEGTISPTGVVEIAAGVNALTGIVGCGFYDNAQNPIAPNKISLLSGALDGDLDPFESIPLTFACDANGVGYEEVAYG
jgi:hypothetical protein